MPKKLITEDFILRAIAVHGSRYDYSKVSYFNAETKICIVCPIHGEFYQIPIMHLYGHGCKYCANEALKKPGYSVDEFISKALKIHGLFYDYSKIVYKNTRTKVCIKCPQHGEFYQKPNSHLKGQGCKQCGRKKISPAAFMERAHFLHDNKYTYDISNYKNTRSKIRIICPDHGEFFQSVNSHLKGHGCTFCRNMKFSILYASNTESFIKKAIKIHGEGKYDYSRVNYKSADDKVCIICPIHGEFYQESNKHLRGSGCKKCAVNNQTTTVKEFIEKANRIHGLGRYDYSRIKSLKNNKEKICIICPKHGEFWQTSGAHTLGTGCRRCASEKLSQDRAMPQEEFINRANKFHKNRFDYSKINYINSITKVCIICPIHGEFYQNPHTHLRTRGCPQCKYSLGERAIIDWFNKQGIEFEHFYKFPDLVSSNGNPLEFDFRTKYARHLIEFDGEQHYRPVRFNSISEERALKQFKKVQYYDSLKNQYCIKNNIPLLRISYKEFNDIPEILNEKILGIGSYFQKHDSPKYFVNELQG